MRIQRRRRAVISTKDWCRALICLGAVVLVVNLVVVVKNNLTWKYPSPANEVIPPRNHPHAGARDEKGSWGYVPDVTAIRRRALVRLEGSNSTYSQHDSYFPLEPELENAVCQVGPGYGCERRAGYTLLHSHVKVNHEAIVSSGSDPRILCVVYTTESHHDRIKAIINTWGWRCDGWMAASTKTDPSLGAVDLPHTGPEEYSNMWQKPDQSWHSCTIIAWRISISFIYLVTTLI
jgi:hypothetical protein